MRSVFAFALLCAACGDDSAAAIDAGDDHDAPTGDATPDAPPPSVDTFVSYLGGSAFEQARDVAVDREGNIIVVGGTQSANFPVTTGAYDTTFDTSGGGMLGSGGPMDVFVTKISPTGTIVWSTFVGGPSYDRAYAVEVDDAGDIYIAGRAGAGFPTTAGVLQPAFAGDTQANGLYGPQDGFISKLSSDGTTLLWSTYYGGGGRDFIRDMDIDATGVYVGVGELSLDHPHVTSGAFDTSRNAAYEVVVGKVSLDGASVLWGTYFGGNADDSVPTVRSGPGGVYLISATRSTDLPVTPNAFQATKRAGLDFYVAKLAPDGASLVYCTYLGGDADEDHETHHGVVDDAGRVVVGFYTTSSNLPTSATAFRRTRSGTADAYVGILSADGTAVVAGTYVGGTGGEDVQGLAIDSMGRVVIGGGTSSADLMTTSGAFQPTFGGGAGDVFVGWLPPDLSSFSYQTFVGGAGDDHQRSLWIDAHGNAVSVGQTASATMMTTGAFQASYAGATDAYVAAFRFH